MAVENDVKTDVKFSSGFFHFQSGSTISLTEQHINNIGNPTVLLMNLVMVTSYKPQLVSIAQSVERKTEDLEAACSIHARDIVPFAILLNNSSFYFRTRHQQHW